MGGIMKKQRAIAEQDRTVPIHSIWEAAYIVYKDIPYLNTLMRNGRMLFIFPDTPEVKAAVQKFIRNPPVKIQEYISVFQRLKNLIYEERGKEHETRIH